MSGKTGAEEDSGVPRWVKMFGLIAAGLLILAIGLMLLSGGQHGPGRHLSTLGAVTSSSHTTESEQSRGGGAS